MLSYEEWWIGEPHGSRSENLMEQRRSASLDRIASRDVEQRAGTALELLLGSTNVIDLKLGMAFSISVRRLHSAAGATARYF